MKVIKKVGYVVAWCLYKKLGLTLVFPDMKPFESNSFRETGNIHLFGLIHDKHISIITSQELELAIRNKKTVEVLTPNYNAQFIYIVGNRYDELVEFSNPGDIQKVFIYC